MRATFHDSAGVEDKNGVGCFGRREPVGDRDRGSTQCESFDCPTDLNLQRRVNCGRRLVEDEEVRVRNPGPHDGDELALACR